MNHLRGVLLVADLWGTMNNYVVGAAWLPGLFVDKYHDKCCSALRYM